MESVIGNQDELSNQEAQTIAKAKRLSEKDNEEEYNKSFTIGELKRVLEKLPQTAPGNDGIYPQYVKQLDERWVSVLLDIMNTVWDKGCFPKIWKDGIVTMIPKQGKDSTTLVNYRMITLLSVLGKVYERFVKIRLNWALEKPNC